LSSQEVEAQVTRYRDWFLELEPRNGPDAIYKVILVLFPDLPGHRVPSLIDATQARLRPGYVERGLMIGEFHDGPPEKAGLWNSDFRPLASPVPMLVIRHMVPTDFAFLCDDQQLLAQYLARFRDAIPAHLRQRVRQRALAFGLELPPPDQLAVVHPRVKAVLAAHGVPVTTHRHADLRPPIDGPRSVARALRLDLQRITKSLFLRCTCHGRYSVVVCSVNRRVDLRSVASVLGCKRLELASEQELAALLGFSPGGVCALAVAADIPVLMDEDLLRFPTVLTAAGEVAVEIEIDPSRLREIAGATMLRGATKLDGGRPD
jgi:prolyl-tRNA editing enzyme YbaK/EbsC (Cys-tRNA(Pro) deacylase)